MYKGRVKANILVVEDDENLGFILNDYLEMLDYQVELRREGVQGLDAYNTLKNQLDLCIFDVMMPLKDGFTLAQEIRKMDKDIPIIFLTAKSLKADKIQGFKIGADDYITKPFSSEELSLRIEAVIRRSRDSMMAKAKSLFHLGKYVFDFANQTLSHPSGDRGLTKKEAEVLRLLCLNENQVLRRDVALKTIWGEDDYFMGRSMDVYITKIRKYLEDEVKIRIINVHGTGFKLEIIGE